MVTRDMVDQATRYAVYLERLKTREVRDFNRVFDNIEKVLKNLMNDLDYDNLEDVPRADIEALIARLQKKSSEMGVQAIGQHIERMDGVADLSSDFAYKVLDKAALGALKVAKVEAGKALKAALKEPMKMTGDLLEPWLRNMTERETRRMGNAVRQSWANGDTVRDTVKKIAGTKAKGYKDGVTALSRREAATAVRTSMSHISSSAQRQVQQTNNDLVKGFRWVSTLDGQTSPPCRSLDGRVFKLDDLSAPRPPIHPNCRSVTVPDLGPKFTFLREGGQRASIGGPVDSKETYYSWLKKQPVGFQNDAIGVARSKLLRQGGLSAEEFAKLNLGRNFEELTLKEMKAKMPEIFRRAKVDL